MARTKMIVSFKNRAQSINVHFVTRFVELCRIVEIMGEVPEKILKTSSQEKISKFFTVVPYLDSRGIHKVKYNLNWPPSLKRSTGLSISDIIMKIRQPIDRISVLASLTDEQKLTYELFVDLVLRMLDYDPDKRITPHEALKHPFCKISRGTLTHRSNSAKRKGNSSIEYLPPIGKLQL
jgi:serine/threonine protein kinase